MKKIGHLLVVALIILSLLGMAGFLAAGCGGSDEKQSKADLSAALAELQATMDGLEAQGDTLTVGDLKQTKPFAAPLDKVFQAAKGVPGADTAALEAGVLAIRVAGNTLSDTMTLNEAIQELMPIVTPVIEAGKALQALSASEE